MHIYTELRTHRRGKNYSAALARTHVRRQAYSHNPNHPLSASPQRALGRGRREEIKTGEGEGS
eukprot:3832155-Pleurochrysis_carterae.AAC.1